MKGFQEHGCQTDQFYLSGYGFVPGRDPLHFNERRLRRIAAAVGLCLLLVLLLPVVCGHFAEAFASMTVFFVGGAGELQQQLREALLYLLSMALPLLLLQSMLHPAPPAAPEKPLRPSQALAALVASVGMGALLLKLGAFQRQLLQPLHLVELYPGTMMPAAPAAAAFYLLRMLLFQVVFEELFFRGAVLQALRPHGDRFALFFSSLCGGLVHYNLSSSLSSFALSLMLGYFLLVSGSIRLVICCKAAAAVLPVLAEPLQRLLPAEVYEGLLFAALAAGILAAVFLCLRLLRRPARPAAGKTALTFRRKLWICLACPPMAAAAACWLFQIVRHLRIV